MSFFQRFFGREPPAGDTTIGTILLRQGLITRPQLLDAIHIKMRATGETLLGEILISRGAITRMQLDRVLVVQRASRGTKVDYTQETRNLIAGVSARAENLHGPLDALEDAARRFAVTQTFPIVKLNDTQKH